MGREVVVEKIDRAVWDRAKQIFEGGGRKDRVWGTATNDGRNAFTFTERTSPDSPTMVPLNPEERKPYIEMAKAELKDKGDA